MAGINHKLRLLEEENKEIRVSLVGAGLMGKGMVSQMMLMRGMKPALVISRNIKDATEAYKLAGVKDEDIVICNTIEEIDKNIENNKYVASSRTDLASKSSLIDVVVDATGVPNTGAEIALDAIMNKKHMVMVNIEADVTVGPILAKLAKSAGVVYTGTAGDEPGSVKEIYDFADALGFEIIAIGKGKNNPIDYTATPDKLKEKAEKKNLNPVILTSFVDGTNTMIEMAAMSNATGLIPDIVGSHGVTCEVKDLPKVFNTKEEGGILNKKGVVDYVHGIAPGVFAVVSTDLPQVKDEMKYLSMGDGPNYVLYRPYHLTSLETPITVARAYFYNEPTIAPKGKPVAEVVAMAKRDLKKGEYLDGIGRYTILGKIDTYENAKDKNLVPIGLIDSNTKVLKDIKKGEFITRDMIELNTDSMIYKLRQIQDGVFN